MVINILLLVPNLYKTQECRLVMGVTVELNDARIESVCYLPSSEYGGVFEKYNGGRCLKQLEWVWFIMTTSIFLFVHMKPALRKAINVEK